MIMQLKKDKVAYIFKERKRERALADIINNIYNARYTYVIQRQCSFKQSSTKKQVIQIK